VPYFRDYARRFTDLPLLVTLRKGEGAYVPDRLLRASDLDDAAGESEHAAWKPVVPDARSGRPFVPNGSVGHRYGEPGRWNLRLDGIDPLLSVLERAEDCVPVDLPRFDMGDGEHGSAVRRGVPAVEVGGHLVTTVFDLTLAHYGVARPRLPGEWPAGHDDGESPYTPAWQEQITGVDRRLAARVAR
jgi:nitrate reductase alpha subunit